MSLDASSTLNSEAYTPEPLCKFDLSAYLSAQYWLIAVFGGAVCVIGIGFNIALLQVLFQPKLRSTYLIYLAVLAIMDILILITYILVPVVGVLFEYYESYFLYRLWHSCVRYFYALSRVVTLASTYLVLACTIGRYWEVIQLHSPTPKSAIRQSSHYFNVACVVLGAVAFRLVVLFELVIVEHPECYGTMAYVELNRTELVQNYFYAEVYSFWAVHVVQVFFPFPLLVLLNVLIGVAWRSVVRNRRKRSAEMKRLIERSQSARQMMLSIVTSYLVCNSLHMVLTCLEHINVDFLNDHQDFYALASDVVSLLTAINASSRLPIYYATNVSIRMAIQELWLSKRVQDLSLVYRGSLRSINSLRRSVARRKKGQAPVDNEQEACYMIKNNNNNV